MGLLSGHHSSDDFLTLETTSVPPHGFPVVVCGGQARSTNDDDDDRHSWPSTSSEGSRDQESIVLRSHHDPSFLVERGGRGPVTATTYIAPPDIIARGSSCPLHRTSASSLNAMPTIRNRDFSCRMVDERGSTISGYKEFEFEPSGQGRAVAGVFAG
jgi:hypothetical protein